MRLNKDRRPLNAAINILQEKCVRNPFLRRLGIKFYKLFFCSPLASEVTITHKEIELAHQLRESGYVKMKPIPNEQLSQLISEITKARLYNPWSPHQGDFLVESVPEGVHVARVKEPALVEPALKLLSNNESVLNVLSAFFKCKYIIDSVDIWWSFPNGGVQEEAEFFHRDKDSLEFIKWFVYLSDVDLRHGPHEYAPGSVKSKLLTRSGRYTDREVYESFDCLKMVGVAGDNFLENTYGLHRGYTPLDGRRLLLQFRFSIQPSIFRYRGKKSELKICHPNVKSSFVSRSL